MAIESIYCDLIRVLLNGRQVWKKDCSIWSKIEESGQSRKNHDLNSSNKSKASALRAILWRLRKVFLCLEGNHSWRNNLVMNSKARELRMPWLGRLGQQEMGRSPGRIDSQTGDRKPMKTRSGFCLWIMSTWKCSKMNPNKPLPWLSKGNPLSFRVQLAQKILK